MAALLLLASAGEVLGGGLEGSFRDVVAIHLERYPAMEIQDLYKLAYQAAMGSEHAVPDRQAAAQWLARELAGLQATTVPEPLSEPLSPDGRLIRVNLRTFRAQGGDRSRLLEAFLTTATRFAGSQDRLSDYWDEIEAMAITGAIPFEVRELRAFFSEMESQGFPAVHHSASYREHYKPAYRVVLLDLLGVETRSATGE